MFSEYQQKIGKTCLYVCVSSLSVLYSSSSLAGSGLFLPINRSSVVEIKSPAKEVVVANPEIADVHVNNAKTLTVLGKAAGSTNMRLFDENGKLLQTLEISVGYDLPAIRKALKNLLPDETIGVEMINTSVALTGSVKSAVSVDKALKIAQEYVGFASGSPASGGGISASAPSGDSAEGNKYPKILNMLKMASGQQVMLKVRVSEVNRDALKRLGIDPQVITSGGNFSFTGALGSAISGIVAGDDGSFPAASWTTSDVSSRGTGFGAWQTNKTKVGAAINALERDGLIKTLAEPNLVAVSGEQAEFLAGGEIPVLAVSSAGGASTGTTANVEYKPYGVSVKFTPDVLSENRIRMIVQPEVSEISSANAIVMSGFTIPSLTTRRAKTTVELAPGESFMIAGLIKDHTSSAIDQLPGVKELPILGALFRSTEFQRNESELVITVTPYLVDPIKDSDIKLPSDDLRPASQVEMFFYGALGALTNGKNSAYVPQLEGPAGFMVD